MAESRLNLIIQTTGAEKLRKLKGDADKVEKEFEQLADSADKAGRSVQGSASAAGRAGGKFRSLGRTIGQLAGAYVGLRTAQDALQAGLARGESERRLTALARGYGEVEEAAAVAARAAERFGLSQTQANNEVAKLYGRLRTTGSSLEDVEAAYMGFNTALKVNGTNAQEAAGAMLQLSQALGSGVLRGEEFNSVFEATPAIVVAIAEEMNVATGAVRDLAKEGKVTSDVVIRALKRIATTGAPLVDDALDSNVQKIKDAQNAFEDLQVALTQEIIPEMTDAIRDFTELLKTIAPIVSEISKAFAFLFRLVTQQAKAAYNALENLFSGNFGELFKFNKNAYNDLFGVQTGPRKVKYPVQQFRFPSEGGGGGGATEVDKKALAAAEKAAEKARKDAERLAELRADQLQDAKDLLFVSERELALSQQESDINRLKVRYNTQVLTIKRDTAAAIAASLSAEETLTLQMAEQAQLASAKNDFERQALELKSKEKDELTEIEKLYQQVGQSIQNTIVDGIMDAVEGAKDLNEVLTDTLRSLSQTLLKAGLNSVVGGLFPDIPGRAKGGPVSAGQPYVVGEKGPELFVPTRSGTVIPNGGGGVNSVVNVNVTDSGTSTDATQASELGRMIESSVMGVINRERRPGGVLSR